MLFLLLVRIYELLKATTREVYRYLDFAPFGRPGHRDDLSAMTKRAAAVTGGLKDLAAIGCF